MLNNLRNGAGAIPKRASVITAINVRSVLRNLSTDIITVNIFVPHENLRMKFPATIISNLKTVADANEDLKRYLLCACSGNAICSTCHVHVDLGSMDLFDPPDEAELDVLDLVGSFQPNSRLGCQLVLKKECDGVTFSIPEDVNNLM